MTKFAVSGLPIADRRGDWFVPEFLQEVGYPAEDSYEGYTKDQATEDHPRKKVKPPPYHKPTVQDALDFYGFH